MTTVRVHLESDVIRLHAEARDWSELSVTRLLSEPLFSEAPNRILETRLVETLERTGACHWELRLRAADKDIGPSDGDARRVCQQIVNARQAAAVGALAAAMFRSVTPLGANHLRLETRFPIARVSAILANPALAPHDAIRHSGPFHLEEAGAACITLVNRHTGGRLELIRPSTKRSDDSWHVSGPMGPTPDPCRVATAECWVRPLDMVYALILPRSMNLRERSWVRARLDRERLCAATAGRVRPAQRFCALWDGADCQPVEERSTGPADRPAQATLPIYFTDFPGNAELARAIAVELSAPGCMFEAIACEYSLFLEPVRAPLSEGLRLAIVASPWPDPAAMLAASYFSAETADGFREVFWQAMSDDNVETATLLAADAEDLLVAAGSRIVVIGQVLGSMWSTVGRFWSPPSAWTDYSLIPAWDAAECE